MARKKLTESATTTEEEANGRLIDVLQSLTQEVETLNQQVGSLTQNAQVLTEAIDDVRVELEWATRNLHRPAWAPTQSVTSVPRDALAENFEVNRARPEILPSENRAPNPSIVPSTEMAPKDSIRGELF